MIIHIWPEIIDTFIFIWVAIAILCFCDYFGDLSLVFLLLKNIIYFSTVSFHVHILSTIITLTPELSTRLFRWLPLGLCSGTGGTLFPILLVHVTYNFALISECNQCLFFVFPRYFYSYNWFCCRVSLKVLQPLKYYPCFPTSFWYHSLLPHILPVYWK